MATATVTKPTLTYFNFPALAEPARLLLEDAGVDYEFNPIAEWAPLKNDYIASGKTPFGQLPLYEEPGFGSLVQSGAILRYLAKKHGYNGANAREEALIDQTYEGVNDLKLNFIQALFRTEEAKKEEAKQKFLNETLPAQLEIFTKLLQKNGNNGFFVGSKLSYADIGLWAILNLAFARLEGSKDVVEKYPAIKSFLDGFAGRDRIKAYLARDVYAKKE